MKTTIAAFVLIATMAVPSAAQQTGEMSLLQATLVVARDVFAQRCPQHIAITDKTKHDQELAYVKRALKDAKGDMTYAATRKRVEPSFSSPSGCDQELAKHKAQTHPAYTYSNITLKK